jgi:hypothetical protein
VPGERTRTLRFERQDTDTGADDPSVANNDVTTNNITDTTDDPTNDTTTNVCLGGIIDLLHSTWDAMTWTKAIAGEPAIDRLWTDPEIQPNDVVVRCIQYGVERPSLLVLVVAFETVSKSASLYSIAACRHCMWLADSLSVVLERKFTHRIIVESNLQGR